jgi:hypothetical protein
MGVDMQGGLTAWLRGDPSPWRNPIQVFVIVLALVAILLPRVRDWLALWIDRARQPSPSDARKTAVAVGVVVFLYIIAAAYWQGRDLGPGSHDVHMYLLQARFLSTGRLWTAAHPMADFFETFYVFTKPVYAPMYFPGTALLYLPWAWFGIPAWLLAAAVGGTAAALMYLVIGQLLDGAAGIVAALLVPTIQQCRLNAVEPLSHPALLMIGLLTTWTWLCWRRTSRGPAMTAVVAAAMSWAIITRPIEGLCYVLPIGVAMLLDLRGRSVNWVRLLSAGALAAAPLLALQFFLDVGVTGSLLKTPTALYAEREWSGFKYLGFSAVEPKAEPTSSLPEKHDLYVEMIRPSMVAHRPDNLLNIDWLVHRLGVIAAATLPNSLLLIPFMVGVLGIWAKRWWVLSDRRWVLFLPLPLFFVAYAINPALLPWYALTVIPAVLMMVMAGFRLVERLWPRAGASISVLSVILPLGLAMGTLPGLNPKVKDNWLTGPSLMHWVYNDLPRQVQRPALVLFTYKSGVDVPHEEPVYNIDVVNIDDAPIIKAHDLGSARNAEIIRYYGQRQPNRRVYLCDRATRTLTDLGPAGTLIATTKGR